jgi:presenilin-like A22 family membrane protease
MKHTLKVTAVLVVMFIVAQLIGIFVANVYLPETKLVVNETTGEIIEIEQYNLPYGLDPPEEIEPVQAGTSIIIALAIAVSLLFLLMKLKAETFLRLWFLLVMILGIAIALNAFIIKIPNSAIISLAIAIPLGIVKIFQRNFIVHNTTELLIYPGIASVFIPLLNIPIMILLLILISLWDMYAVWKSGIMQKMAMYQMEKLQIFTGFFIPYLGKKERAMLKRAKAAKKKKGKEKKIKLNLAILGGGDVVFPILLAGVVLKTWGLIPALIIPIGATIALAGLFYISKKGKFYPAMPFISAGCFAALAVAYFVA